MGSCADENVFDNEDNGALDYEIVDLQVFWCLYLLFLQPDDSLLSELDLSTSLEVSTFLNDLVPNDKLYSQYLNGTISFDDLMREVHCVENVTHESDISDHDDDSDFEKCMLHIFIYNL